MQGSLSADIFLRILNVVKAYKTAFRENIYEIARIRGRVSLESMNIIIKMNILVSV